MTLPLLALLVLGMLALGYTVYGRWVARQYALDDARATPAVAREDGVDFVPTRPFYLLGQHFSAIAAAGPIAGPILACQQFGWVPCVLWIALGVVFVGAVHDVSALVASVRHQARSVAEIVRENLGPGAWRAVMAFIWLALVYVIVAFTDVTASTFVDATQDLPDGVSFNPGGAVALAAVTYLLLAMAMGLVSRRWRPRLLLLTLVFVPATLGAVWLGTEASTLLLASHRTWSVLILAYCFAASLVPVWLLLQPRGYLGGFVLYLALALGTLGMLFGGFSIQAPAFTGRPLLGLEGSVFPFLFVTIACGACSGFHGLVCSGTTSKQIAKESHCHPVGYGAMLLEGFVALVALATVLIAAPGLAGSSPARIYADGLARFFTRFTSDDLLVFARTFGAMAFSTFVFDTLDVATRLGRYLLEELFGLTGRAGALLATGLTVGVPLVTLLLAGAGGFTSFWVLFGTSNQLLAGLTLLGITVWLRRQGRRAWFTIAPMLFVLGVTLVALVLQAAGFARRVVGPGGWWQAAPLLNLVVAAVLLLLAGYLGLRALRVLRDLRRETAGGGRPAGVVRSG